MAALLLIELLAASLISIKAVVVINRMNRTTHPWLARAWVLLGSTAAHFVYSAWYSQTVTDSASATLIAAVAAVILLDRRKNA